MLEHVEHEDEVEPVILKRQFLHTSGDCGQTPLGAEGDRIRRGLDSDGVAQTTVLDQVASGPATGVKDLGVRRHSCPRQQRPHHGPTPLEPPMGVLQLEEIRIDLTLHAPHDIRVAGLRAGSPARRSDSVDAMNGPVDAPVVSVVVPVCNEEQVLGELRERLDTAN